MSPKQLMPDPEDAPQTAIPATPPAAEDSQAIVPDEQPAQAGADIVIQMQVPLASDDELEARMKAAAEARRLAQLEAEAAQQVTKHTVVPGDTLSGIAAQYYNDAGQWPAIYEANKDVIGDNPNLILVGQELTIPKL